MSIFSKRDRVSDILNGDFWNNQSWRTHTLVGIKAEGEMSILPPEGEREEPLLKIEHKDADGIVLYQVTMNLAALDEHIGKLIRMRDILETMKS